jgi:hypothetical protein
MEQTGRPYHRAAAQDELGRRVARPHLGLAVGEDAILPGGIVREGEGVDPEAERSRLRERALRGAPGSEQQQCCRRPRTRAAERSLARGVDGLALSAVAETVKARRRSARCVAKKSDGATHGMH